MALYKDILNIARKIICPSCPPCKTPTPSRRHDPIQPPPESESLLHLGVMYLVIGVASTIGSNVVDLAFDKLFPGREDEDDEKKK